MYEDRVAKGAELLDRARPGWFRQVDLDRLAMRKCDRCVLGQLHGDYFDGLHRLKLNSGSGVDLGFDVRADEVTPWSYAALANAWRDAIRERLAGGGRMKLGIIGRTSGQPGETFEDLYGGRGMKVIFLDIDGCLNGHEWVGEAESCDVKPECVRRLNRILRETGAALVISSAWRYMIHGGAMTIDGFHYLLRTHGLTAGVKILGITPPDEEIAGRGSQIAAWLVAHPEVTSYVVIDDDDSGEIHAADHLHHHLFVCPASWAGLTDADADRAIELLNGEDSCQRP